MKDELSKLSQWWDSLSLSQKLAQVLLPVVGTISVVFMLILHLTLGATFLNSNKDVTGWGSLIIGSAIGIYITFAILIYSNTSQKKTDEIIQKVAAQQDQISMLVTKVDKIIEDQEQFRRNRYDFEADVLRFYLDILYDHWVVLEKYVAVESPLTKEIENKIHAKNQVIQNIKEEMQRSIGIIEPEILENIDEICYYAKLIPDVIEIDGTEKLGKDKSNVFPAVSSFIDTVFKKLPETKNLFPPKG